MQSAHMPGWGDPWARSLTFPNVSSLFRQGLRLRDDSMASHLASRRPEQPDVIMLTWGAQLRRKRHPVDRALLCSMRLACSRVLSLKAHGGSRDNITEGETLSCEAMS